MSLSVVGLGLVDEALYSISKDPFPVADEWPCVFVIIVPVVYEDPPPPPPPVILLPCPHPPEPPP